jgi:hypothetical protein
MEVDGVDEVLPVAKAARRVLHLLNLGVERLAASLGDAVLTLLLSTLRCLSDV